MPESLNRKRSLRQAAALLPCLVCLSGKLMFLSHPNSAAFSPKSPWTFGPQTRHEHTNFSTEPATCNATGPTSKKSVPTRTLFPPNSETLPSYSIYPANRSDCSRPWNISWYIYEKSATMFILLLKDVIFTLQDFTDRTGWLHSVSRLNNNYGNAETKAAAVFYSSYRSRHHILIYYCRTVLETFFQTRGDQSCHYSPGRQKGQTSCATPEPTRWETLLTC